MRGQHRMIRRHIPDMQIMYGLNAFDLEQILTHTFIINMLRHTIEQMPAGFFNQAPSRVEQQHCHHHRQNWVNRQPTGKRNDQTRRNRCHRAEQIAHHMHQCRTRVHRGLITHQQPRHQEIHKQAQRRHQRHRFTGDGGRMHQTGHRLKHNPADD